MVAEGVLPYLLFRVLVAGLRSLQAVVLVELVLLVPLLLEQVSLVLYLLVASPSTRESKRAVNSGSSTRMLVWSRVAVLAREWPTR